jgi:hypothetical protein
MLLSGLILDTTAIRESKEGNFMPHLWPEETDFATWELDVLDRDCPHCGRRM